MAPNYGLLVKEAIVLLDKFNSKRQRLDDFIKDASNDLKTMKNVDKKFIFEVISGCVENKKLLDAVISIFYDKIQSCLLRRDRSQFAVICYLTTFCLNDLGLKGFRDIVQRQDIKKMQMFVTFFFTNLTTHIQAKWNNIYDAAFVEENWIGPLLRWRPEIDALMEQVCVESCQGDMYKKAPIKTTQPKEFSFAKPKPRPLPTPEIIPQLMKFKPVPTSTYRAPKEMQKIRETKVKNQQTCHELLYEANVKQFKCAKPQKSEHTKKMMSQIQAESDSKLQFNLLHSSILPANNKTNVAPIKDNRTTRLRKEALDSHILEKESQRVEDLAAGASELSAFNQRQKEILVKDRRMEQVKIVNRIKERKNDYRKGTEARNDRTALNQRAAQMKKEETAELMRKYAGKRLNEKKEIKALVQQVSGGHMNAKTAKEKLQRLNQIIVREVSLQNREILHKALQEEEAELIKKFEIIQAIHAIESVPRIRVRKFDDTETEGDGLLGEMSLFELKERLFHLKEQQQREVQEKRERLLAEKKREKVQQQREAQEKRERLLAEKKSEKEQQQREVQEKRERLLAEKKREKELQQREVQEKRERRLAEKKRGKEQQQREVQAKRERLQAEKKREKEENDRKTEELERFRTRRRAEKQADAIRKREEKILRERQLQEELQSERTLALDKGIENGRKEVRRLRDEERQKRESLLGIKTKTSQQADMQTFKEPEKKIVKVKTMEEILQGLARLNQSMYGHQPNFTPFPLD